MFLYYGPVKLEDICKGTIVINVFLCYYLENVGSFYCVFIMGFVF